MAQTTITIRVDDTLKKDFDNICDDLGLTNTTAITIFMKTVIREQRIPFEIRTKCKKEINDNAWDAFLEMRKQVADAGSQGLSLKEINKLIKETRDMD